MTPAPARLLAHSEEVLIADKWLFSITVCTDVAGRPWEVVLKCRDRGGREGSDTAMMAADLGISISRMMQGRDAVPAPAAARGDGVDGK
jgi:hypothetical protein